YLEGQPDDTRARYVLGRIQYLNGAFAPAAQSFEQVANRDARNTDAAMWAVASYQSAGGAPIRAKQTALLEKVVTADPNNLDTMYLLAMARGAVGDTEGQIEVLRRLLTLQPENLHALWGLGLGMALGAKYRDANLELSDLSARDPSPEVLAASGLVQALSEQPEAASQRLVTVLESPGLSIRWHVLTELGRLLIRQGQYREAEQYLREAAAERGTGAEARYLLALSLEAQGLPQQALAESEALSRENGEFAGRSAIRAATLHLILDNPTSAQAALERADAAARATAQYLTVQGRVLAANGDGNGAQSSYKRAIDLDVNYAPPHLESALIYIRSSALVEGLVELELYVALMGPDFRGPQADQIRELVNQLKQTTGREA
ncbi:MAG: tetratricopeptide repeat protein, partial [Candidatus Hydrogenedentota bacterium]